MNGSEYLKQIYERYAACAPINKPSLQKEADNSLRWMEKHLTAKEIEDLENARKAVIDDGKPIAFFNEACKKVRKRIF